MVSENRLRGLNTDCNRRLSNLALERLTSSSLEPDGHQPSSFLCSRKKALPMPQPRQLAEMERTNSNLCATMTMMRLDPKII
jgi:hypothetical protein